MTTPVQLSYVGQTSVGEVKTGTQKTTESKAKIGNMLNNPEALVPGQGKKAAMGNMIDAKDPVLASKLSSKYMLTQQIEAVKFDLANDKLSPEQKTALKAQRAALMRDLAKLESEIKILEKEIGATQKNVGMDERIGRSRFNIET